MENESNKIILTKDVIISILRISSNFSVDDCMNARLVASYVRHDYIIKEIFKPWHGFAKLMNHINYFKKHYYETMEFTGVFASNRYDNPKVTGVEISESIDVFVAFVSNYQLYCTLVKSYTNMIDHYYDDDFRIINWTCQPSYVDEYNNLIQVFWSQIITSTYHIEFAKYGLSGMVKWKCDSYKTNEDVTTEITELTNEKLGCAIKMTSFIIDSKLLSKIKSITRFPGKEIIVLIE